MGERDTPLGGRSIVDLETSTRLFESGKTEMPWGEVILAQSDASGRSWRKAIESSLHKGEKSQPAPAPEPEAPVVSKNPSPLGKGYYDWLAEKRREIVDHERGKWNSLEMAGKVVGGSLAALRFGGTFALPNAQEVLQLSQIATERQAYTAGGQAVHYSGALNALRAEEQAIQRAYEWRGVRRSLGGVAAGAAVSFGIDKLFFDKDQSMEGTLIGDIVGIGLAIALPSFRAKTIGVIGAHLAGKLFDHGRQPQYHFDREKQREQGPAGGSGQKPEGGFQPKYHELNPKYFGRERRV